MQDLVNGLAQGAIYSLAGVGLVLIFSVVRVPNFAHGEPVMVAAMLPVTLMALFNMPLALALVLGVVAAIALGIFFSVAIFSRLSKYPEVSLLIISLALVVMISSLAVMFWGDAARQTPGSPSTVLNWGGVRIPVMWIIIFFMALAATVALDAFIRYTTPGRAMRAMALNPFAAKLMGIPVARYHALAFGIGSGLAGVAGALFSLAFAVQSSMGAAIALKAFIVIIFAGMGSIWGAFAGGLLLGLVESYGASYLSSGYRDTFGFIFLLGVLLIKPNGLFARRANG
ncbi:branched-chain amino acid ABC transporter permease [Nitratireductor aestuarii]|uniref:Branched-chain amino acid ABC transporter permease n=1 Tax=Nitratireductor aestuarii TaxID=1735103 RepID=A0A916S0A3_9HYPH|nr:branched-chain amino acid ABC transporter permease [Nitratireductor aestuarii]GGA78885.1 branched-chain amino acid ABC transporter permease [Nitratireductor aestuarii]